MEAHLTHLIEPSQIESELEKIWDSLQGTNKMRACLFNLIIYSKKSQRIGYLSEITQKIIEKFPCRIIFITHDETCSSHDLKTSVSVLTADEGEYEIVCDLIEIEVCSKDHPRVPFVILPHILPDLPIYLVYADDPSEKNPVAENLKNLASRIIFDSEGACSLPLFAKAVLGYHERCHGTIADLNWARTEGWRSLFASVFKGESCLEEIKHAKTIEMHYNSRETNYVCHTSIQSIYLTTWLAVQLGWTLKKIEKPLIFHYESTFGPVEVSLHGDYKEEISPGRLLSIEIYTDQETHYSFTRRGKCLHHVMIQKSSPKVCFLPTNYVLDKDVSGQSLVKEICHTGTSTHYTKVLALLSSINLGDLLS